MYIDLLGLFSAEVAYWAVVGEEISTAEQFSQEVYVPLVLQKPIVTQLIHIIIIRDIDK